MKLGGVREQWNLTPRAATYETSGDKTLAEVGRRPCGGKETLRLRAQGKKPPLSEAPHRHDAALGRACLNRAQTAFASLPESAALKFGQ